MGVVGSRWLSLSTLAKAFVASLIAVAGLTVVAVPSAFAALSITTISPTSGSPAGGNNVTISGTGFGSGATEVYFGFDITSANPYGVQATEVSSAGTAIVVHAPVFELTSDPTVSTR